MPETLGLFPRGYQEPSYKPGNWSDIFSQMASNLSTDAAVINQITAYLASAKSNAINDILRASGIQQLQTQMTLIQNDFNGLKQIFTSDLRSGDVFDTSLDVISRAERIVDTLDRLDDYANSIMSAIDTSVDFVSSLPDKIEDTFNKFSSTLEKLTNFDLSNTLDKLPDLVADNLLNLDIIQDPLILLNNVQLTVTSIATTVTSIRAPANLNDVRALLTTLRSLIAKIRSVRDQAQRVQESISRLASLIQSGNYLSLVMSLAAGGVTFFQRPPAYNARYPFNHGFKTHGGHVFERDNTPKSERIKYQHPAKTSLEVQPDGGVVVKGENDFQLSVSKNFDVLIKNAATITVQGDARIIANTVQVEAKTDATITSTGKTTVNSAQDVAVTANGSVQVISNGTATVAANASTSISSNGEVVISGTAGIRLETPGNIILNSNALTETVVGAVLRTNGNSITTTGGPHVIRGTPIELN